MCVKILYIFAVLSSGFAQECSLPEQLIKEIESYQPVVNKIIESLTDGEHKGKAYEYVAEWVDKFGARLIGTENLENAIDYLMEIMKMKELENVHGENASVPHWERNVEKCTMLEPRETNIPILALGTSVSTPQEGIEAEAVVVTSFSDLINNYNYSVEGKIVIYNYKYTSYWKEVNYRVQGAFHAAQYGAAAALVRSVTPFSLRSLHTGMTHYRSNVTKIPTAAITVEDANFLLRLQKRGEKIVLKLNIQTTNFPDSISRNVIGELKGESNPEKVVIVSGHSDSWDVGQGVMDDAAGAFVSWYSTALLKQLNLKPKRTVRAIVWTSEENRLAGAKQYFKDHENEINDWMLMIESDEGTFTPLGLKFIGGNNGNCVLKEILKLVSAINATEVMKVDTIDNDITIWNNLVPCGSLYNKNDKYFWYHHTEADMLDVENADDMDKVVALFASVSYVIADMENDFPKD